jgi:hypothetical protein
MKTTILLSIIFVLVSGCATPYQSTGFSGGHTYERINEDIFAVTFSGNGFTKSKRTKELCLLRCAEVTQEFKFSYFTIEKEIDEGGVDTIHTSTTSTTTGTAHVYGNTGYVNATTTTSPSTMNIYKPGTTYVIRCYDEPPTEGHFSKIYKASEVADELKEKYKIKEG